MKTITKSFILVMLLTLSISITANGQGISGTKTIGSGGDYATINVAVTALESNGVSGPVVFNIVSGTYKEQFTIHKIKGASPTNTITFQSQSKNNTDVEIQYTQTDPSRLNNWVIKLDSASCITFKNMTITTKYGGFNRVIDLDNYDSNITFENDIFTKNDKMRGIIYASGAELINLKIIGNVFNNGKYSIYLDGKASGNSSSNMILNNRFYNPSQAFIYITNNKNLTIDKNIFHKSRKDYLYDGVYLENCSGATKITNNILDITPVNAPIYLKNCISAPNEHGLIANNFINTVGTGIELNQSDYQDIVFNTIKSYVNDHTRGFDEAGALVIYSSPSGQNIVENNIFDSDNGNTALEILSTHEVSKLDYNAYYTRSNYIAAYNGKLCEDLA